MDRPAEKTLAFLTLADKGRHAWWRYLLTVILAFAIQTVVLIVGAVVAVATGTPLRDLVTLAQDPGHPVLFFSSVGMSFAGLLIGFIVGGAWLHKKTFNDYVGRWSFRALGLGIGVWLIVLLIDVGIGYVLRPDGFDVTGAATNPAIFALTCVSLAIQTFTEEFIFRGYVTQGLLKLIRRPVPASIISGLIFGALHIPNGWPQAASATLLGIGLSLIAIKIGGLAYGYGLHLINNVFSAVIVVSGGDVFKGAPGLIQQNTPELFAIDVGVVAVALAIVVAAVYRRNPAQRDLPVGALP